MVGSCETQRCRFGQNSGVLRQLCVHNCNYDDENNKRYLFHMGFFFLFLFNAKISRLLRFIIIFEDFFQDPQISTYGKQTLKHNHILCI